MPHRQIVKGSACFLPCFGQPQLLLIWPSANVLLAAKVMSRRLLLARLHGLQRKCHCFASLILKSGLLISPGILLDVCQS